MSRRIPTPRPWLRELMQQKDMTVRQLAVTVDVTDVYIRYIQAGTSTPSTGLAIKIGEALGLSEVESLVKFFGKTA